MKLNSLIKTTTRRKKRVGLGYGSGRPKTSGRGTKGQNSRSSRPLSFEGGALPLIKRLPFMRGKGRNKPIYGKQNIINVEDLNSFKKNSIIDEEFLIQNKIFEEKDVKQYGVKILGNGKIEVALVIKLPASKGAKSKIEKAGGRVEFGQKNE